MSRYSMVTVSAGAEYTKRQPSRDEFPPMIPRSSRRKPSVSTDEHYLACNASFPQQLLRLSSLGKRESPRNQWLYLLLLKEVQQSDQILFEPIRFEPFECLDAVGDHAFSARQKPAAGDVQGEGGGSTEALTTTWTTRAESLPTDRSDQAIAHRSPARAESLA